MALHTIFPRSRLYQFSASARCRHQDWKKWGEVVTEMEKLITKPDSSSKRELSTRVEQLATKVERCDVEEMPIKVEPANGIGEGEVMLRILMYVLLIREVYLRL